MAGEAAAAAQRSPAQQSSPALAHPHTPPLARSAPQVDEARAARSARPLAYVLVQGQPRLVLGAADEARSLAEAGIQPRTSLQVIPHATDGHQPPAPAPAPAPQPEAEPEAAPQAAAARAGPAAPAATAAAAAATAAAAAAAAAAAPAAAKQAQAPPPPPPPPSEVQLQVRLSNGDSLRRTFPAGAKLADVLDWVDGARTDR